MLPCRGKSAESSRPGRARRPQAAAKAWAIAGGVSDGSNPGNPVTRQQLVTILYRFAAQEGYDTSARADLSGYPDVGTVADYAAVRTPGQNDTLTVGNPTP